MGPIRTRTTLGQVLRAVKIKEHYNVPLFSCVDVIVCSRNHLSRALRSPPSIWQKVARTQSEGRYFTGEARGIGGSAPKLRRPFGEGPAEPVVDDHMPSGTCVEGETIRTVEDSALGPPCLASYRP